MALTFTDGTITSTSSEQTITDITGDAYYAFWIHTHNMTASESITIKIYVKDQNGGVMRIYQTELLSGVQSEPSYFIAPLPTKQYKVTIQRTAGSDKAYTWQLVEIT